MKYISKYILSSVSGNIIYILIVYFRCFYTVVLLWRDVDFMITL